MTDFSKLASAVVQYDLSVDGEHPSDVPSALGALVALAQKASTPNPPIENPDLGDLVTVYTDLEIWSTAELPHLYAVLDTMLRELSSSDLPSVPLPELTCADIRAPARPGQTKEESDFSSDDDEAVAAATAPFGSGEWNKCAELLRKDADRFIACATNVLNLFEKTWTIAIVCADQRLTGSENSAASTEGTESTDSTSFDSYGKGDPLADTLNPPIAPWLGPTPPNERAVATGKSWLAHITRPMESEPWASGVFRPLRSIIVHFAQDATALATQERNNARKAGVDQENQLARWELGRLWGELQNIERSAEATAPAQPFESGKWIDGGAADDNKMDSLVSSLDMLLFFMQETFAIGGRAYGEFFDISGNRRWRFEIAPTQWAEGLSELGAFISKLESKGGTGTVLFTYLDKIAQPWQRKKAACTLSLRVEGTATRRVTRRTEYGSITTYDDRMKLSESDQYRDGKDRMRVHYVRGA
ncbi:MAG: hypothetical protein WBW32_07995 [Luteibacter sp.]